MRLLLDTHVLLWSLLQPGRLDEGTQALVQAVENTVMFSSASIWEIAIKARLNRDDFTARPEAILLNARAIGLTELSVHSDAAALVVDLPLHHRDPFDRLLVAQSMTSHARLLTLDAALARYGEAVLLVR